MMGKIPCGDISKSTQTGVSATQVMVAVKNNWPEKQQIHVQGVEPLWGSHRPIVTRNSRPVHILQAAPMENLPGDVHTTTHPDCVLGLADVRKPDLGLQGANE
jgi:hypothetical protein